MEKISGILKPNYRTRSTDVSGSQPVRPGAPTYGRPVGRVTTSQAMDINDVVDFSPEAKEKASQREKLDMVKDMADKFNLKRAKEEASPEALSIKITDDVTEKTFDRDRVVE